ncbi:MAG: hypothetical protein AAGJ50_00970 [Pseudomonadota bacterium]
MSSNPKSARFQAVRTVIADEQAVVPPERAVEMAKAIRARHGATVRGFVFYGSSLREAEDPGKMLDYYVLVDRYRDVHGVGPKALASFLLPPSVHYFEAIDRRGCPMTSKYSIVSLKAFLRRASGGAREPMIWARFSQPCLVMECDSPSVHDTLLDALANAVLHFADETTPMISGAWTPREFWSRALSESYRTELRAERPLARAREIVERFGERYDALGAAALWPCGQGGKVQIAPAGFAARQMARFKWATRRWVGKPATALRVLKGAFTFDGGLDYVLHKLKSHSGASIEVSEHQRRHPLLWSPVLAWKLWRRGAFR